MGVNETLIQLELIWSGGWQEDAELCRHKPPYGPRNALSNIAYAVVGFGLLYTNIPHANAGTLWAMMTALALGSGYYHWYKNRYFQHWDHNGMLMVFGALAVFGWYQGTYAPIVAAGVGFGVAWWDSYWRGIEFLDLPVGVLLALAFLPIAIFGGDLKLAGIALVLYVVGYGFQRLDHAHRTPKPLDLWGHAIWHVLTAVAIGLLALAQVR